jgi:hypothetical protein
MLTVKPTSRQKADRSPLGQGDNPTLSTLKGCPGSQERERVRAAPLRRPRGSVPLRDRGATASRPPDGRRNRSGSGPGHKSPAATPAPGCTTQPRLCCIKRRASPEITSHHVTALCPLDLRHETRAKIASHCVTALWRLDLRQATPPEPAARAHPGEHSPARGAPLGHTLRILRHIRRLDLHGLRKEIADSLRIQGTLWITAGADGVSRPTRWSTAPSPGAGRRRGRRHGLIPSLGQHVASVLDSFAKISYSGLCSNCLRLGCGLA